MAKDLETSTTSGKPKPTLAQYAREWGGTRFQPILSEKTLSCSRQLEPRA